MKNNNLPLFIFFLLSVCAQPISTFAQGTAFTYQGRLTAGGTNFTGNAEFQATLWNTNVNGSPIAANNPTRVIVGVTNGLFVLPLDFGTSFQGGSRWLQLDVRTDISPFTMLSPRQQLTPAPYAMFANTASNLSGVLLASQVSGTLSVTQLPGNVITNNASGLTLTGNFNGNGANVTNVNAATLNGLSSANFWKTGGNAGTSGAFLGTTDNLPLELRANNTRVLRLEYAYDPVYKSITANVLGGYLGNVISNGVVGGFIGGGGNSYMPNRVGENYATVLGGLNNVASGFASTSMGVSDKATGYASIAMGSVNTASGSYSTAMGSYNIASGDKSTAMGSGSTTSGDYSTAIGESSLASGLCSTVVGSKNTASGDYSIAMGVRNSATNDYAFAIGYFAKAYHQGAFVWSDNTSTSGATSTAANSVTMRASGGYRLFSNSGMTAGVSLAANGTSWAVISDRNVKKDFAPVDNVEVLEKLAAIPVTQWRYQWEDETVTPHIGPMAQDFKAAFYPGSDDKSITTQEADGVTFAAIQGLNKKLEQKLAEKETQITGLERELVAMKARLAKLEELLK